jgi:hypothetical protein
MAMDFDRLERVWRSTANSPNAASVAHLMEEAMDTLKRKRRDFEMFTGLIGLGLIIWTAKVVWEVVTNQFSFDPGLEWGLFLLLGLPWIALFSVRRAYNKHLHAHPDPYASAPDTLRALMDENDTARQRVKLGGLFMVAMVVVVALVLWQLLEVGKMSSQDVMQGSLLFGGLLVVVGIGTAADYAFRLRPEGRRLRQLLREYDDQ